MDRQTDDQLFDLAAARAELAELTAQHAALVAGLPAAELAVKTALRGHEDAQAETNALVARCNRAGAGVTSGAVRRLIEAQQAKYYAAQCALTKARNDLAQLRWDASCRADDINQLRALIDPPAGPTAPTSLRPRPAAPDVIDDADLIVFPGGRAA
jgi:hypothetical protein